jgi:DNA polymerase/3'-5' exonuclease PolX
VGRHTCHNLKTQTLSHCVYKMSDISNVYGIGVKKANELKTHYNIRTVRSLRSHVRKLPDIVSDVQRLSLKYHDKVVRHVTLKEAERHVRFITKRISNARIAGSIRRRERKIGDIDVVVTSTIKHAVNTLTKAKYIIASLAVGLEKFSGIVRLPGTTSYRRIDIVKTTRAELPFTMLYFTGDYVQNISMRQKAKRMGYSLSQHGLKNLKSGRFATKLKTEMDIFKFLGIDYKEPEERKHAKK